MENVNKNKTPSIGVWDVTVEWVSGQSGGVDKLFKGSYAGAEIGTIVKAISEIITLSYSECVCEEVHIESNSEEMTLKLLAEIIRREPKLEVNSKPCKPGSNWGYNISVISGELNLAGV